MEKQQINPRDGESEVAIMGDLSKQIQSETTTHASNSNSPSSSASMSDQNTNDEQKLEPTIKQGLISIVKSSWINPLVIFIPFAIASHFVWSPTVTFILNFIAIVPLAKLLGFATEDIALRTGEVCKNENRPIPKCVHTVLYTQKCRTHTHTKLMFISWVTSFYRSLVDYSTPLLAMLSS